MLNFLEFVQLSKSTDDEIRDILRTFTSQHHVINDNATVQKLLNYTDLQISYSDLVAIHKDISSYIMKRAPKTSRAAAGDGLLALSEIAALQSFSSLLNALVVAKSHSSLKKLADLNTATRFS